MELSVRLRRPDDSTCDITVICDAEATVGELAKKITELDPELSYTAPMFRTSDLTLEASSIVSEKFEVLDPEETLGDLALASGLEIAVVPSRSVNRAPVAYIEFLGGPVAGQKLTIPRGSTFIGRGSDNDVVIEDPMVSKRHARVHVGKSKIELIDLNSANGILVQGEPVQRLEMQTGQQVLFGSTTVRAGFLPDGENTESFVAEIIFTRSPHVEPRYIGKELESADFPRKDQPQAFPFLTMIMPVIMGVTLYLLTKSVLSLMFIAISPFMMLSTWITQRSQRKRAYKDERARFETQLSKLEKRLIRESERESKIRSRESLSLNEIHSAVMQESAAVWKMRSEHWSFLHLRLGVGEVPSRNTVKETKNPDSAEEHDLDRLEKLLENFKNLPALPVVENVSHSGAIGVVGNKDLVSAYTRGLIAQISGLRAPDDALICGIFGSEWSTQFTAAKWLPHAKAAQETFGGIAFGETTSAAAHVLAVLEEVSASRTKAENAAPLKLGAISEEESAAVTAGKVGKERGSGGSDDEPLPAIFVFISEDAPVDKARLIHFLEKAAGKGIYPIFLAQARHDLPAACRTFVEFSEEGSASVGFVRLGRTTHNVVVEGLDAGSFEIFVRKLAAYVDAGALQQDAHDVPKSISMLRLLGEELASDPHAVVDRWRQNGSLLTGNNTELYTPKLRAIVGQSASGAMHLDLRTHGPHALVGGTTGSGKSEFLQSWVLGMAAEYSPQRVTFLFVDYKGGAAFAECTKLPHSVGLVTDLSPHLVRRALVSLRAELHFRENLFTRKKVKDILELEKTGDPDTPPALVIVIDEFAALVGEVPEFVDGVVDVAQRGRSLGIHLIMATQRPAGVIKDNLRANTNLRVALRMADEVDSDDVLGDKLAARFDPELPGRAAAKTGPGRLTVFQSAYAGGWTFAEEEEAQIALQEFIFGPPVKWEEPKRARVPESELGENDQQLMVHTMILAAQEAAIAAPRRPWLDELEELYDVAEIPQDTDRRLILGKQDRPKEQAQEPVYFEMDVDGHLAIFGTSGSGKSGTLRTLAAAAGRVQNGGPVHVYALDFGAGGLRMLEDLPHVGAVISGDQSDRVMRLFRNIKSEIVRRSELYANYHADTISAYREAANVSSEPRILIMVDGFPTFKTEYEGVTGRAEAYDVFSQIMTDGRSVGIHIALTADRGQAIPNALQSLIQKRVVLRMSDDDGYAMLGVPKDILSEDSKPGRAIIGGLESQIAILGGSPLMNEQAAALKDYAEELRARGALEAPEIKALPEVVLLENLPESIEGRPVLGLSERSLEAVSFEEEGLFVVAGGPGSGRTNAMLALAHSLKRHDSNKKFVLLAPKNSTLIEHFAWNSVANDGTLAVSTIDKYLSGEEDLEGLCVFIEGVSDFGTSIAEMTLNDLAGRAKRGECLIVSEGDTSDWHSSFGLVGALKASRKGLVLSPDTHDGDLIFKTPFPRLVRKEFPPGRALYVASGKVEKIQLPLVEN